MLAALTLEYKTAGLAACSISPYLFQKKKKKSMQGRSSAQRRIKPSLLLLSSYKSKLPCWFSAATIQLPQSWSAAEPLILFWRTWSSPSVLWMWLVDLACSILIWDNHSHSDKDPGKEHHLYPTVLQVLENLWKQSLIESEDVMPWSTVFGNCSPGFGIKQDAQQSDIYHKAMLPLW